MMQLRIKLNRINQNATAALNLYFVERLRVLKEQFEETVSQKQPGKSFETINETTRGIISKKIPDRRQKLRQT